MGVFSGLSLFLFSDPAHRDGVRIVARMQPPGHAFGVPEDKLRAIRGIAAEGRRRGIVILRCERLRASKDGDAGLPLAWRGSGAGDDLDLILRSPLSRASRRMAA
jgi:hypothetical protein